MKSTVHFSVKMEIPASSRLSVPTWCGRKVMRLIFF